MPPRSNSYPIPPYEGASYKTLRLTPEIGQRTVTLLIDPSTHFLRRVKQGFPAGPDEVDAQVRCITVEYTTVQINTPIESSRFAWTPPAGAENIIPPQATLNRPAPDFQVADLDGNQVQLSGLRGNVIVLDFRATWCGPCQLSLPMLQQVAQDMDSPKLRVFAINRQENPDTLREFARRTNLSLPVLMAAMKGYELATVPVAGTSLLTTRWFLVIGVEFELALGFFLIAGLLPKMTWWISILCFTGFVAITANKAWMGDANCGCFGRAQVDPRITLALDIAVLAVLLIFRPRAHIRWLGHASWLTPVAALLLLIGIPGGWLMATAQSASINDSGLVSAGSFIVLEPEKWAGKPLPLFNSIDIGGRLRTGKWIVVLYSHTCSHCVEALPKYLGIASRLESQGIDTRMALVQIPPFADSSPLPSQLPGTVLAGRLEETHEWFAETPVEILLDEGKVVRALAKGEGISWWPAEGR